MLALAGLPPPSVEEFLTYWYGPPDGAEPAAAPPADEPGALRDWFATVSRWSRPVTFQNEMLRPEERWTEDGKTVFWVENQGVWLWAYEPGADDPAVYDREAHGR